MPWQTGGTAASEDASHGRKGGGADPEQRTGQPDATGDDELGPDRARLGPKQTLAAALDQIAAGNLHMAAGTLAQRLRALELSTTDASWNRAQFIES